MRKRYIATERVRDRGQREGWKKEVEGENDNGRRGVEFCEERGLFKHRSVHKYTRVARGRKNVEIKNMIDLVLVRWWLGLEG